VLLVASVLGVGVAGAAVVLPARPNGAPAAAPPVRSGTVADLIVSVSVTPNRPGVNGFTVRAASNRRPAPAPIDDVALQLGAGGVGGYRYEGASMRRIVLVASAVVLALSGSFAGPALARPPADSGPMLTALVVLTTQVDTAAHRRPSGVEHALRVTAAHAQRG